MKRRETKGKTMGDKSKTVGDKDGRSASNQSGNTLIKKLN